MKVLGNDFNDKLKDLHNSNKELAEQVENMLNSYATATQTSSNDRDNETVSSDAEIATTSTSPASDSQFQSTKEPKDIEFIIKADDESRTEGSDSLSAFWSKVFADQWARDQREAEERARQQVENSVSLTLQTEETLNILDKSDENSLEKDKEKVQHEFLQYCVENSAAECEKPSNNDNSISVDDENDQQDKDLHKPADKQIHSKKEYFYPKQEDDLVDGKKPEDVKTVEEDDAKETDTASSNSTKDQVSDEEAAENLGDDKTDNNNAGYDDISNSSESPKPDENVEDNDPNAGGFKMILQKSPTVVVEYKFSIKNEEEDESTKDDSQEMMVNGKLNKVSIKRKRTAEGSEATIVCKRAKTDDDSDLNVYNFTKDPVELIFLGYALSVKTLKAPLMREGMAKIMQLLFELEDRNRDQGNADQEENCD